MYDQIPPKTPSFSSTKHAAPWSAISLALCGLMLTATGCDSELQQAQPGQHDEVIGEWEGIIIPALAAADMGLQLDESSTVPGYHRSQVRVVIEAADHPDGTREEALFTVVDETDQQEGNAAEIFIWDDTIQAVLGETKDGKQRLELTQNDFPSDAAMYAEVTTHTCAAAKVEEALPSSSQNKAESGFGECLDGAWPDIMNLPENYVFLAPHGGEVEPGTDEQAIAAHGVLSQSSYAWYSLGWRKAKGAYDHWHITSTDISRYSFPELDKIGPKANNLFNGFTWAVAFHGMSAKAKDYTIYVGGTPDTECARIHVRDALANLMAGEGVNNVEVEITEDVNTPLKGASARNIVNWMSLNGQRGIQLEQTKDVRDDYGTAVATTVAAMLPTLDAVSCP
ncbi:MAG: poly-gamma-glutamate hydrolase family protein [Nannocystales bacterium]